ncbi:MAG: CsgG/HfaB family protein [Myxococcota bacterium]
MSRTARCSLLLSVGLLAAFTTAASATEPEAAPSERGGDAVVARPATPEAAETAPTEGPTVAVLYFDYSGENEEMAVLRKGLAQMLVSDLSGLAGIRVVERERLEEVLAELELQKSRKIDQSTAAKIGKLLGAKYLVLGAYFELMGTLRADARVVEVETGRVIRSFGFHGKPGDFLELEQKLGVSVGEVLTSRADVKPQPEDARRTAAAKRPKAPKRLATKTALRYSRALDAKDKGDVPAAKAELQAVVAEQPDFQLASAALDRLMQ